MLSKVWGPLIGPVVSLLSFVCSIGNVPLAAVLWNGGISFGGVVAFIFADLIIVPILVIYRKYYGTRMMLFVLGSFYAHHGGGRIRRRARLRRPRASSRAVGTPRWARWRVRLDYTTVLNIVFLLAGGRPGGPLRADRRSTHVEDDGRCSRATGRAAVTGHCRARRGHGRDDGAAPGHRQPPLLLPVSDGDTPVLSRS